MRRVQQTVVGAAVVVMGLGGTGVAAAAPAPAGGGVAAPVVSVVDGQRHVPEAIRVPAGNRRIAVMPARGVQTYQCTAAAWTFLQPDAILRHKGRPEVLHSKGPVWTSVVDGSSVTAAARANSPVDGAIPELLLGATSTRGPGLLGSVTFIQRLDTTGGLAPTGSCVDGATVSVPYTADYAFWVAATR